MATPMTPEERALVEGYFQGQLPPAPVNAYTGQSLAPAPPAPTMSVAPPPAPKPPLQSQLPYTPAPPPEPPPPVTNAFTGQPLPPPQPPGGVNLYTGQPLPGPAATPAPVRPPASVRGPGGVGGPTTGVPGWLRRAQEIDPSIDAGLLPRKVGLTVDPFTQNEQQQLGEAEGEQFKATLEQGEAQIKSAQDIADRTVEAADQQAAVDSAFADREIQRQQEVRGMENNFMQMADEIANTPIETPNLWGDNTGSQIVNRIALLLGTIGSGVSGQPNMVWEKLNRDVEQNIARQKERIQLKQGRLKDQAMMIDMARARFQDERTVDAVMKEAAYRKIGAELQRFSEFAKTPERQAALDALMAQNNIALTMAERDRRAAMDEDVLKRRAMLAARSARPDPLAALVKKTGQYAQVSENLRKINGTTADDTKLQVPGFGKAGSPESATAMKTVTSSAGELERNLKSLENLTEQGSGTTGAFGVGSDDYKEAEVLVETAVAPALAKVMASGFNPSGPIEERANSIASGLTSKNASTRAAARAAIKKRMQAGIDAAAEAHIPGYKPAARVGGQ